MTSHFSIGLPTWQSRMPRILTDSNFKQPQHSTSLRAKRSNPCSRKGRVDCFVASLLAMTANTVSRSRCMFCPRFSARLTGAHSRVHAMIKKSRANNSTSLGKYTGELATPIYERVAGAVVGGLGGSKADAERRAFDQRVLKMEKLFEWY